MQEHQLLGYQQLDYLADDNLKLGELGYSPYVLEHAASVEEYGK